ncbi:type III pantothenate kinase, partial [Bacillus cereus]|uniref:type III pantothenate kinase n=1 Tax=Bacillus cereus TaxID=1396 RepID=UPI00201BCE5C
YMGSAIAPGITRSTEALYTQAARLPRIEIVRPSQIVGKTTVSAMQAGIFYGFVGQVEGIVKRMKLQSKEEPLQHPTGGLA